MRRNAISFTLLALLVLSPHVAAAQNPPQPSPTPQPESQPPAQQPAPVQPPAEPATTTAQKPAAPSATTTADQPPVLSRAASSAYERHDVFPSVNVYLPEGQASLRLRKLIRNVLFETQIDYRFVNGDISTFLRYKYYARNFTYRIGVFDQIGFPDLGQGSAAEFQRTRGGLLLFEFPRDYNKRYYWLIQDDRLTFGDVSDVDNRKNNVYTKVAYQYGTQFDERMNAIVGESRGRITPVLTAFRDLGPQKFSFAGAITESAHVSTGAYKYTKVEGEALKRSDITPTSFLVTRLHLGAFFGYDTVRGENFEQIERYSVPQYEMFRLGGPQALRSIGEKAVAEGTHEVHLTNEYFVPVFRNRDFKTWLLHWNTLYAIGYAGAGSVAYKSSDFTRSTNAVIDAGIGGETTVSFRDYDVILSVIYAHTLHAPDYLKGGKLRVMIRTMR